MTPLQQLLGFIYLPLHMLVLPLLFQLFGARIPENIPEIAVNIVYYGLGLVFTMIVMFSYLRDGYYVLTDRLRTCVLVFVMAMGAVYLMDMAASMILLALGETISNPATTETVEQAMTDFNTLKALAVFIAPIVEETLFRGVLFGALRERSRVWAYVLSVAMFSIYHVWQYAYVSGDWTVLIYAIQYIPASLVLTWCYERTGSIWTGIFFHMGYNGFSFALIEAMLRSENSPGKANGSRGTIAAASVFISFTCGWRRKRPFRDTAARRKARPRCAAAGYTWPRGRCGSAHRS